MDRLDPQPTLNQTHILRGEIVHARDIPHKISEFPIGKPFSGSDNPYDEGHEEAV
jgi:hypothetical protein